MDGQEKKVAALHAANSESKAVTRESIKMALLQLMKDNDFEKITVTAIINRSGVSRAGFYRNYSSKEDVIEEMSKDFREKLQKAVDNKEYSENPYLFYRDVFASIHSNPVEFRLLVDANVPEKYALDALPVIPQPETSLRPTERYRFIGILSSLRAIVYDWFRSGMKENAEEMAGLMVRLFHK